MNLMRRTLLAGFMVAAGLRGEASAQSIADTVERWGMLGTWAVDCRAAPLRTNGYYTFVRQGDRIESRRDFGDPAFDDISMILAARVLTDGSIEISEGPKDPFVRVMVKGGDGRIRAMSGRLPNGEYTVRDGVFVRAGTPTQWQTRCR